MGLERGVYTTSSQIIGRFGNTSLRLSLQKVGRAMRELGFRQVKASNANYWVVVERTTEEVQHLLPAEAEQAKSLPRRIPNSPSDTLSGGYGGYFSNFPLYESKKYLPLKEKIISISFI